MESLAQTATPGRTVEELIESLSLAEKLAQLQGLWANVDAEAADVAPTMSTQGHLSVEFESFAADGLGQLTRVYGTAPVRPRQGLVELIAKQRWLAERTRPRLAALVHEECLTGLNAWTATTFPTPLAWGASFDPDAVAEMARAIGQTMRCLGIHQGLAPVLDVVADHRWGRVEECIGEDPYLVATLGKAYVEGIQSAGVVATLKHFAGYSDSRGGRNLAPVAIGPRQLEDIFFVPFEIALKDAGAGSVMHSYCDVDGVPVAANPELLTGVLRERWGFQGTVVADYFGVSFLKDLHRVAADLGEAAVAALSAGVDVELPTGNAYRQPLEDAIRRRPELELLVDRALERVLRQKERLGLLDASAEVERLEQALESVPETLDPPAARAAALRLAQESVVLLDNHTRLLPLTARPGLRLAVVGPNADRTRCLFGCYSFANHVLSHHPATPSGIAAPTVLEALRDRIEAVGGQVSFTPGCPVAGGDRTGFADARALAAQADVVVAVVGDESGLFGEGTSGEGCDTTSLRLPGLQNELIETLLETGTPLVAVLITGRPHGIGGLAKRAGATLQAFFPGEEGGTALAQVLTGEVTPSGRLPVSMPPGVGVEPYSYLHSRLAEPSDVTSVDPTPDFAFGHGLSYTSFEYFPPRVASATVPTDGWIEIATSIRNSGERAGAEVVQLYGNDRVASVARPVAQLLGFARVPLAPGQTATVVFRVPTGRLGLHDRSMTHVVEPGEVDLWFGRSCAVEATSRLTVQLDGPVHVLTEDSPRLTEVQIKTPGDDPSATGSRPC